MFYMTEKMRGVKIAAEVEPAVKKKRSWREGRGNGRVINYIGWGRIKQITSKTEVGIYKRKQESKKARKHENKNSTKWVIKKEIKFFFLVEFLFSCFLDRCLGRVLVFLIAFLFEFLFSYFIVFFYKLPPQSIAMELYI